MRSCGGNTASPGAPIRLQHFLFPTNLFLPSPGGNAVTFFSEEVGKTKRTKCPGNAGEGERGGRAASTKGHQEELHQVMVSAVFHVQP